MIRFLVSLIVGLWISTIALVALQNAAPVSLQFLGLTSVQVPLGLVLAFSATLGLVVGAAALEVGLSSRS